MENKQLRDAKITLFTAYQVYQAENDIMANMAGNFARSEEFYAQQLRSTQQTMNMRREPGMMVTSEDILASIQPNSNMKSFIKVLDDSKELLRKDGQMALEEAEKFVELIQNPPPDNTSKSSLVPWSDYDPDYHHSDDEDKIIDTPHNDPNPDEDDLVEYIDLTHEDVD